METLKVGDDLTKSQAEVVSQRVLSLVKTIQTLQCLHNDLRFANIIIRDWPQKIEPVLIDFSAANVQAPDEPLMEMGSGSSADEVRETRQTLSDPDYGGWHVASPLNQRAREQAAVYTDIYI
ncbi:hypothetical protein B0H10DRAFT_2218350 [Mycena sp. CBHHK59/15]|nr:hypothetical protein B0H10DRAFT_2218350 [Mycena sp. CBHHK59/15]